VPGVPASLGNRIGAPPQAPPFKAPPPEVLPNAPRPSAQAQPGEGLPSEPYLFAQTKDGGGAESEPFFQQVDPWRPVRGARMYAALDYLLWWTKEQTAPSVTTLPGVDVGTQAAGASNNDPRSGIRGTFGGWITPMKDLAWEASFFYLGEQVQHNTILLPATPPSTATLPFFFGTNSQSSTVTLNNRFWGAETNLRYQLCCFNSDHVHFFFDALGGFRYVNLSEGMIVQSSTQFAPAPVLLSGASVTATDNFFAHNNFYGAQLGGDANIYLGRFHVNVYGKVALGENFETVNVSGFTTVVTPVTTQLLTGGFLTAPSNIGHHTRNNFAAVPETGVNLGFRVLPWCELGAGFTFLYLSDVGRPGDQIAPVSNAVNLPAGLGGAASQPTFRFQENHFWATGVNARVMFIF
jgi:hypothetical protein